MIDTALPSEFADKPGLIRQSVLKPIFIGMFIWPAILAWLLRHADADPIAAFLQQYFVVPPSLKNFTDYWFKGELVSKSVYLSCWYVNALVIGAYQLVATLYSPEIFASLLKKSPNIRGEIFHGFKWLFLALIWGFVSTAFLSAILYAPDQIISPKHTALLFDNTLFYGLMWTLYPGAIASIVFCPFALIEAFKHFNAGVTK